MKFEMRKYICTLFLLLCLSMAATAQNPDNLQAGEKYEITEADYRNQKVEMADVMRSNGKIYVVVGVIVIIFAGLLCYAIALDRKLRRLEKEMLNVEC